jgi:hypothetical protein
MTKSKIRKSARRPRGHSAFGFLSDFGLRASDFICAGPDGGGARSYSAASVRLTHQWLSFIVATVEWI